MHFLPHFGAPTCKSAMCILFPPSNRLPVSPGRFTVTTFKNPCRFPVSPDFCRPGHTPNFFSLFFLLGRLPVSPGRYPWFWPISSSFPGISRWEIGIKSKSSPGFPEKFLILFNPHSSPLRTHPWFITTYIRNPSAYTLKTSYDITDQPNVEFLWGRSFRIEKMGDLGDRGSKKAQSLADRAPVNRLLLVIPCSWTILSKRNYDRLCITQLL